MIQEGNSWLTHAERVNGLGLFEGVSETGRNLTESVWIAKTDCAARFHSGYFIPNNLTIR